MTTLISPACSCSFSPSNNMLNISLDSSITPDPSNPVYFIVKPSDRKSFALRRPTQNIESRGDYCFDFQQTNLFGTSDARSAQGFYNVLIGKENRTLFSTVYSSFINSDRVTTGINGSYGYNMALNSRILSLNNTNSSFQIRHNNFINCDNMGVDNLSNSTVLNSNGLFIRNCDNSFFIGSDSEFSLANKFIVLDSKSSNVQNINNSFIGKCQNLSTDAFNSKNLNTILNYVRASTLFLDPVFNFTFVDTSIESFFEGDRNHLFYISHSTISGNQNIVFNTEATTLTGNHNKFFMVRSPFNALIQRDEDGLNTITGDHNTILLSQQINVPTNQYTHIAGERVTLESDCVNNTLLNGSDISFTKNSQHVSVLNGSSIGGQTSLDTVIVGGNQNVFDNSTLSVLLGGESNRIQGQHSAVFGKSNQNNALNSFIMNGENNRFGSLVENSSCSSISNLDISTTIRNRFITSLIRYNNFNYRSSFRMSNIKEVTIIANAQPVPINSNDSIVYINNNDGNLYDYTIQFSATGDHGRWVRLILNLSPMTTATLQGPAGVSFVTYDGLSEFTSPGAYNFYYDATNSEWILI